MRHIELLNQKKEKNPFTTNVNLIFRLFINKVEWGEREWNKTETKTFNCLITDVRICNREQNNHLN